MNKLRFISSFTTNTIYERIANEMLRPTLEHFALPYHIFAKPVVGSWKVNSRQRPLYIKEAMEMFPGENLVWIDADAKVLQFPDILFHIPDACDIGVNYMWWSDHYGRSKDNDKLEILDGTSYYKNDPKMLPFMNEWIERSVNQEKNHRIMLDTMIKERQCELNIFLIPREYCYIMTQPNGEPPVIPVEKPVIAHSQASRKARHDLYEDRGV